MDVNNGPGYGIVAATVGIGLAPGYAGINVVADGVGVWLGGVWLT